MIKYDQIRTYTFPEDEEHVPGFVLTDLDEEFSNYIQSPHQHDYYTIFFFRKGKGQHIIDFNTYPIENNTLFFIFPRQTHQIIPETFLYGWVFRFKEDFLIKNAISEKIINSLYLFNEYGKNPPLLIENKNKSEFTDIIKQIEIAKTFKTYSYDAVGALLKLFLIKSHNMCKTDENNNNSKIQEAGSNLLYDFKKLIEKNYSKEHKVSFYAGMLAVTSDYLNKTVKNISGKSAKEHIQSKLITEAKRDLLFTTISNKELAFKLGFEEAAHFNKFFKKETGITPSEFKNSFL